MWCSAGVDPYSKEAQAPSEMVSFTSGFHGRTLGALALTYKDQYKTPFSPGLPGCHITPYLDLEAAAQVIQKVLRICCTSITRSCDPSWLAACQDARRELPAQAGDCMLALRVILLGAEVCIACCLLNIWQAVHILLMCTHPEVRHVC